MACQVADLIRGRFDVVVVTSGYLPEELCDEPFKSIFISLRVTLPLPR